MQLIWVASPTSKIRKFNITHAYLMRLLGVAALVLMLSGSSFYFLGFRLAIKIKPSIAQSLGGVITIEEQHEIENEYRSKLDELHIHLENVERLVSNLQVEKERLSKIATPADLTSKISSVSSSGGPFIPVFKSESLKNTNIFNSLDGEITKSKDLEKAIESLHEQWSREVILLEHIPTSQPINVLANSNYGNRIDPINGKLAFHSGIDFPAPSGTKVYAAGDGRVGKIESDSGYGLFIEIKHALGVSSKYAHLGKVVVHEGDVIHRGQEIGQVGNTGRSTGPHLHFEIMEDRNFKNPTEFLVAKHFSKIDRSTNQD